MVLNLKYAASTPGILKIIHLVFGAIALGCGIPAFESEYAFERVFLGAIITCFVITFVDFAAFITVKPMQKNQVCLFIDFVYHILGGILLIVGGSLMITSARKIEGDCNDIPGFSPYNCQEKLPVKLSGGSFAIINGVFYLLAAGSLAIKTEDEVEFDPRSKSYGYGHSYGPSTTAVKTRGSTDETTDDF